MSDLTRLNPTPHAIAVYASQPLSPVATQHSLPSRTLPFTWAGLAPAGSHQLCLAHSLDHLVGAAKPRKGKRAHDERPSGRRAAGKHDEVAALHGSSPRCRYSNTPTAGAGHLVQNPGTQPLAAVPVPPELRPASAIMAIPA